MDCSLLIVIWFILEILFKFVWGESIMKNVDVVRKVFIVIVEVNNKVGGVYFEL